MLVGVVQLLSFFGFATFDEGFHWGVIVAVAATIYTLNELMAI